MDIMKKPWLCSEDGDCHHCGLIRFPSNHTDDGGTLDQEDIVYEISCVTRHTLKLVA